MKMRIEKIKPDFENLIGSVTTIEVIAEGFTFTEGPIWNSEGNYLLFSDIPENKIYKWSELKDLEIYRENSHFSNGLTYDAKGSLIACEHKSRSISKELSDGKIITLASHFQGKRLNSPNDVIVSSDGSILFTDPIYGLRAGMGGPADQEIDFQGVYRINPDNSGLELLTDNFERPNGLALSPDEKSLFIIDTVRQHIKKFEIDNNWRLTGGQIWAELWDDTETGRPDGLKVDLFGNLFSVGPGGIWIFSPESELLGRIYLDGKTSNLAWGDDGHSLYITCSSKIFRLKCKTRGTILV